MTSEMTKITDDLKAQRDRYVAFALAAADLLIETDTKGTIKHAIGAANALMGYGPQALVGRKIEDHFVQEDRILVKQLVIKAAKSGRIDPARLSLTDAKGDARSVIFGACYLDQTSSIYLSLTKSQALIDTTGMTKDKDSQLLDQKGFAAFLAQSMHEGSSGENQDLQLVQIDGLVESLKHLGPQQSAALMRDIGGLMRAQSIGGQAAGRLSDESFGVLTHKGAAAIQSGINTEINNLAQICGLKEGALTTQVAKLNLGAQNLEADSVAKALAFVVNNFKTDDDMPATLSDGLAQAMDETLGQMAQIKQLISEDRFTLFYQPVVSIETRGLHHFEALMRFEDGKNPYDVIRFSEQTGLVQEFDLVVCTKAIEAIKANTQAKVAVNLSGGSVQSQAYCETLRTLITANFALKDRLLFELTESHVVEDIEVAANFLKWLRRSGFKVCLDDFGAGAAAYNYLRQFDVDFVKIDGPFLNTALNDRRQQALVRSISVLCKELKIEVIGEMIETEPMAKLASSLGIQYGQGYLFGKPNPQLPAPQIANLLGARRQGVKEGWG